MTNMNKEIYLALSGIGVSNDASMEVATALAKRDKELLNNISKILDKESDKRDKLAELVTANRIKIAGIFSIQLVIGAVFFAYIRGWITPH